MNSVDIRAFVNTLLVYDLTKFAPKVTPVFMDWDTLVYKAFFLSVTAKPEAEAGTAGVTHKYSVSAE